MQVTNHVNNKPFNVEKTTNEIILWIKNFFNENGKGASAVVGISGGKDSSVVAALCVKALGKDKVFGVLMPQGEQPDIDASHLLVKHLKINHKIVNIGSAVEALTLSIGDLSRDAKINLPARIRMTTLYAVAQSLPNGGRVANTCNLSEDYVGYATKFGDGAGDFSPLSNLTVSEVKAIGHNLGLPKELVEKTPIDGLCGKTDEDNLGFTYATLDKYIREGICEDEKLKQRIDTMHKNNLHKLKPMPAYVLGK